VKASAKNASVPDASTWRLIETSALRQAPDVDVVHGVLLS
jgi:hypothetical protein